MIYVFRSRLLWRSNPVVFVGAAREFAEDHKFWFSLARRVIASARAWENDKKYEFKDSIVEGLLADVSHECPKRRAQRLAGLYAFRPTVVGMIGGNECGAALVRSDLRNKHDWPDKSRDQDGNNLRQLADYRQFNSRVDDLIYQIIRNNNTYMYGDGVIGRGKWFNPTAGLLDCFIAAECTPWDGRESELMGIKGLGRPARKKIAEESRPPIVASTGLGSRLARRSTKDD